MRVEASAASTPRMSPRPRLSWCWPLPAGAATRTRHLFEERTLTAAGEAVGLAEDQAVLLLPDARDRSRVRRTLAGTGASIGPARPWREVRSSLARAARGAELQRRPSETIDTDERLVDLVLTADPHAREDLRAKILRPLATLRPSTREVVQETLRSWLLHQGRRADVAADLHVHPQTVRYRMGLARECYGDSLDDPRVALALVVEQWRRRRRWRRPPDQRAELQQRRRQRRRQRQQLERCLLGAVRRPQQEALLVHLQLDHQAAVQPCVFFSCR